MSVPADLVKKLRERTNAGILECKKALEEAKGEMEKAIEILRKAGQAKAVKRADKIAAEGRVFVLNSANNQLAVILEVNSETDFVAREARFQEFVKASAELALAQKIADVEKLRQLREAARLELMTALGENISIRRLTLMQNPEGVIGSYAHGDANGVRIAVLVSLSQGGSVELAKDLAMHVAAMNPEYLRSSDVPASRLAKEREILSAQTREEGKPEAMVEKIVEGRLKKFASEVALLEQNFVKDPAKSIGNLLKDAKAELKEFVRYEVGEGIEKKADTFVEDVMEALKDT